MTRLVECIPNFSEGQCPEIIQSIADAIISVDTARILDIHSDRDHNRSVISFISKPEQAVEAGFRAIKKAWELINMASHRGVHPRIGACDVFPFVPLDGMTMDNAVLLASELGKRVGEELGIPVYLYEFAARTEERKNLANIRRGQYEGLLKSIAEDPNRSPDFGPAKLNLKSGATAIGARNALIAFNVFLNTEDKAIGRKISNSISESQGGFKCVKSLAFEIESRKQIQISMNLTDYKVTSIGKVYEKIKSEADKMGVDIVSSEIIGLIPFDSAADIVNFNIRVEGFSKSKILEERIKQVTKADIN